MFRYFLAFLLINTCYQSLGNPIEPSAPNLSKSLATLATQCNNTVLSKHILNQVKDCAVSVAPSYSKKQLQCLIFYDISTQLCSSNVTVIDDSFSKLEDKQDVNAICALAKDWVFSNISEFVTYKKTAEEYFKLPASCGEVCGVEEVITEANYYCKYYKTGLELLKSQPPTTVEENAPIISQPDFSAQADNSVLANSDPVKLQEENTKKINEQINQPTVAKTTLQKEENTKEEAVKSETGAQATSKQIPSADEGENAENSDEDVNVKRQENPVVAEPEPAAPQANKTVVQVVQAEKPVVSDEAAVGDLPVAPISEQKQAVIENPKPKVNGDIEEYGDSDDGDDEPNDEEIKPEQEPINQQNFPEKNVIVPPVHEADVSQKEFFPNSMPDGFSEEDNDHFFPFFMTSVILMVLLYVLYHNKSKVSKVFFGLILEGRQSGRRRNSRGHAYRRLDTLEQAMSANTAAPPSKIIY